MSFRAFRLSLIVLAATSLPALAATTQSDADSLRDVLKTYLGPLTDQIKIQPMDDGYKATVDFSPLLAMAKQNGVDASLSAIEFTAKPAGGNNWKIHQEGDLILAAKFTGGYINEKFTGLTQDITLDLDQGLVTSYESNAKTTVVDEQLPDKSGRTIKVNVIADGIKLKSTTKANPEGGSDTIYSEALGAWTLNEHIEDAGGPIDIAAKSTGGTVNGNIIGLKGRPLLDILKFGIAHIKQKPTAADQGELKAALTAALPLFKSTSSTGSVTKVEVTSPIGNISAAKIGYLLNANGLVKDGAFEEGISVEGLVIPPGVVPLWSTSLVPASAGLDFKITGFDLAGWSKGMIDAADFTKSDVVAEDVMAKLVTGILPTGAATISLVSSSVANSTYNLSADGTFTAGMEAQPTGKSTVKLSGIDAIMKIVSAAPPEAGLKDATAVMILAKGLGKTGADGSITWDIEATADGQILVNGTDVKKLK